MKEDIFLIHIPKFTVCYKEESYSYTKRAGRRKLMDVLYIASRQYCMYCYTRIAIDNNRSGHLEHAIEKNLSPQNLTNCIPNIGLSCGTCNDRYKKIGEKKRIPSQMVIQEFEKNCKCKENCTTECHAYKRLKATYLEQKDAHIILQPSGVYGKESGLEFFLQYDVLEAKFIPDSRFSYTEKEKSFIEDHINRFHLNTREDRTKQLILFIEDTIEREGNYSKLPYNNLIVELFVNQVLKGKTRQEVLKICKLIYSVSFMKFST